MMEALNITATLGRRKVLQAVSAAAEPGKLTAIAGPNGCGKSTLLRCISGDIPFSGTVRLNGRDVAGQKPLQLAAIRAVQPQSAAVAFPFTVLEIVRLGLSAGLPAADSGLPLQALEAVDLAGFAGRFYQDLSGGEKQRVQLARVLVQVWQPVVDGQPRWLILDEPVSALDIGHQFTVMDLVKDYARRGGGVLAVMHDLNLTAMYADHVVLMQAGRVLADGPPQAVLTAETLSTAYGCRVPASAPAPAELPYLLPQAREAAAQAAKAPSI